MKLSTIFFSIAGIAIFLLIFISILFPAYLSVISVCDPETFEEKYPSARVVGQVSVKQSIDPVTQEVEKTINVFVEDEKNTGVVIHEQCHVDQILNSRSLSCETPVKKYLAEVECYSKESLFNLFT